MLKAVPGKFLLQPPIIMIIIYRIGLLALMIYINIFNTSQRNRLHLLNYWKIHYDFCEIEERFYSIFIDEH